MLYLVLSLAQGAVNPCLETLQTQLDQLVRLELDGVQALRAQADDLPTLFEQSEADVLARIGSDIEASQKNLLKLRQDLLAQGATLVNLGHLQNRRVQAYRENLDRIDELEAGLNWFNRIFKFSFSSKRRARIKGWTKAKEKRLLDENDLAEVSHFLNDSSEQIDKLRNKIRSNSRVLREAHDEQDYVGVIAHSEAEDRSSDLMQEAFEKEEEVLNKADKLIRDWLRERVRVSERVKDTRRKINTALCEIQDCDPVIRNAAREIREADEAVDWAHTANAADSLVDAFGGSKNNTMANFTSAMSAMSSSSVQSEVADVAPAMARVQNEISDVRSAMRDLERAESIPTTNSGNIGTGWLTMDFVDLGLTWTGNSNGLGGTLMNLGQYFALDSIDMELSNTASSLSAAASKLDEIESKLNGMIRVMDQKQREAFERRVVEATEEVFAGSKHSREIKRLREKGPRP